MVQWCSKHPNVRMQTMSACCSSHGVETGCFKVLSKACANPSVAAESCWAKAQMNAVLCTRSAQARQGLTGRDAATTAGRGQKTRPSAHVTAGSTSLCSTRTVWRTRRAPRTACASPTCLASSTSLSGAMSMSASSTPGCCPPDTGSDPCRHET